eukprot:TRINITY_DN79414_c0_g1_i1.p1 TRINITY_DN79414_c0_g1~~TRINITY_DN79414_c0_g1_i1.p1  ORF type:complete len:582 (-),score=136.92 TRINITY_DN79414_c0_g1_i1:68-1813(-)
MSSKTQTPTVTVTPRWTMPLSFLSFGSVSRLRRHNKLGSGELLIFSFVTLLALLGNKASVSAASRSSGSFSGFLSSPDGTRACFCGVNGTYYNSQTGEAFNQSVDYFAPTGKVQANFSKIWSVSYHNYFKRIVVFLDGTFGQKAVIYGYICGAPKLSQAAKNTQFNDTADASIVYSIDVELPLQHIALYSTTFLPWVEYIGQRYSVVHVNADYSTFSPCVRAMFDAQLLTDVAQGSYTLLVLNHLATNGPRQLDAVFQNSFGWSGAYGFQAEVNKFANASNVVDVKMIPVSEIFEDTYIATAEWVEYMALFFNREIAAQNIALNIYKRFNCTAGIVKQLNYTKPKVLIASGGTYGYYQLHCPEWKCHMVQNAGGQIIEYDSSYNDTDFILNVVSQADVWIYVDANWNASTVYNDPYLPSRIDLLNQTQVFQNQRIFDITQHNFWDWFESGEAEPDVLLQDFVVALFPNMSQTLNHTRKFLRNVFTEPSSTSYVNNCSNLYSPRFNAWIDSGCASAGGGQVVVIPGVGGDFSQTYANCSALQNYISTTPAPTAKHNGSTGFSGFFGAVLIFAVTMLLIHTGM